MTKDQVLELFKMSLAHIRDEDMGHSPLFVEMKIVENDEGLHVDWFRFAAMADRSKDKSLPFPGLFID